MAYSQSHSLKQHWELWSFKALKIELLLMYQKDAEIFGI